MKSETNRSLCLKVRDADEEIVRLLEDKANEKVLDLHLSVLKNSGDPYKHVRFNKKKLKKKRLIVLLSLGVCSLVFLGWLAVKNSDSYLYLH